MTFKNLDFANNLTPPFKQNINNNFTKDHSKKEKQAEKEKGKKNEKRIKSNNL